MGLRAGLAGLPRLDTGLRGRLLLVAKNPLMLKLQERGICCFPYFQKNLHQRGFIGKDNALLGLILAIAKFRAHVLQVNHAGATRIALAACRMFKIQCLSHVRLLEDVEYLNALKPLPRPLNHMITISSPITEENVRQPALH